MCSLASSSAIGILANRFKQEISIFKLKTQNDCPYLTYYWDSLPKIAPEPHLNIVSDMNVQRMLNVGRQLFTVIVALFFVMSVAACNQPSVDLPDNQPIQNDLPKVGSSDRSVPVADVQSETVAATPQEISNQVEVEADSLPVAESDSLSETLEKTLETIGDEVEVAADQVLTTVESAIDILDGLNESTADALDQATVEAEKSIQEVAEDLTQSLKKQTQVLREGLEAANQQTADVLDAQLKKASDAFDEQLDKVTDRLDAVLDDDIDKAFEDMYNKVKPRETAVERTFDAMESEPQG